LFIVDREKKPAPREGKGKRGADVVAPVKGIYNEREFFKLVLKK